MLKSIASIGANNAAVSVLGLARNILIARLISVEDFGVASTFAITLFLLEMSTDLGLNKLMLQDAEGREPRFQATLQTVQFLRGLVTGLILFAAAGPITSLFDVPHLVWAYQLFAIVPVLRGALNFDIYRFQKDYRFSRFIAVDLGSQLVAVASAVAFGLILGDFRAMLYSILLQQVAYLGLSQVVAERRYAWAWDRQILGRVQSFGWPLMINGLLIFCIFHGDRVILGSLESLEDLGWFSAALAVTMTPAQVVATTLQSILLPRLSATSAGSEKGREMAEGVLRLSLVAAAGFVVGYAAFGPLLIAVLYGVKYEVALGFIGWLGLMHGLRLARTGTSIVAISRARTRNPMQANIVRALFVPVVWFVVQSGGGIEGLVLVGILGELAASLASLYLLNRVFLVRVSALLPSLGLMVLVLSSVVAVNLLAPSSREHLFNFGFLHVLMLVLTGVLIWKTPEVRDLLSYLRTSKGKGR